MATVLTIPADMKEEEFPFPGGDTFKLHKMSLNELKDLLWVHKQPLSGNKPTLLQRLVNFSGNPAAWNETVAGCQRPHKGPRDFTNKAQTGEEKKPKKKSQVIQRSKDIRTEQQKNEVIAWAAQFVANNPDIQTPRQPKEPNAIKVKPELDSRLANIEGQLQVLLSTVKGNPNGNVMSMPPPPTPLLELPTFPAYTKTSLPSFIPNIIFPPPLPLSLPALPFAISSPPPAFDLMVNESITKSMKMTTKPIPKPTKAATDPINKLTKVLVLGNGTRLEFHCLDVPDPLLLSFVKDIPKLGRVWEDTRPEFSPSECSLKIKGHAIALKHWPITYSYSHDQCWKGTKKTWDNWKIYPPSPISMLYFLRSFQWVAECYHQSTLENFWEEFRDDNGHKMTFMAISKTLQKLQTEADQCLVQQQREWLGSEFSQQFQYFIA
ncbi:hypothetical protein BT96DRAFT_980670 [Gymnopus androsaceus JB14]|uniref:SAP domain-containing protein n=1 Tax=Gymnopus androsaceus JB14 TaxID=1447944 RepID=A0A6A4GUP1_9AGAR|nr:hypothetical protein BT96DRAFT_980670 [Gymnopus androsaceus JB14]